MTLRIAYQMDPVAGLNIAGDSTFALMLAAQARGYTNYSYHDQFNIYFHWSEWLHRL